MLNRYLTEMTDAIMGNGGTLIGYLGDGIIAIFGAPLEQADHADRALAAAEEMLGPRVAVYLDGGPTSSGTPSTILDATGATPRVLRQGAISLEVLHRFNNTIEPATDAGA